MKNMTKDIYFLLDHPYSTTEKLYYSHTVLFILILKLM